MVTKDVAHEINDTIKCYNSESDINSYFVLILHVRNMSGLKKPITLQFGITNSLNNQRLILLNHSDLVSNCDKLIDISPKQTYGSSS